MALVSFVSNSPSRASTSSARPTKSSEKWACSSWFVIVAGFREVSVMVSPLKSTGIYMPITTAIWWNARVIRQAIYEALTSSYQTVGKGDVQPRGAVGLDIEPSDYQESRHRTWRLFVELWGGLGKGVSNYQNSNAKVERMLNDGTMLVL